MKARQLESMISTKKDEPDISSTTRRRMQEVGQKGIVVARTPSSFVEHAPDTKRTLIQLEVKRRLNLKPRDPKLREYHPPTMSSKYFASIAVYHRKRLDCVLVVVRGFTGT